MTGMRNGDTVFDTTRKERRVYDGAVWVTGNMITKTFQTESYAYPGVTYLDSAKCGQIVGYYLSVANGSHCKSVAGTGGGNIENSIGILQFPIGRSYGQSLPAAVQYSGDAYVWSNSIGSAKGQYLNLATFATGGTPGNYWIFFGRAGKDVSRAPGQFGVWTVDPTNVTVASTTSPSGYTGTIALGKANIRFTETN
jgi:hypothetical protein